MCALIGAAGCSPTKPAENKDADMQIAAAQRLELIYAYDPLCGWCYGFDPVVGQIKAEFAGRIDFRIMSGGINVGDRAVPIRAHAEHVKRALPAVERATGARFGQPFIALLDDGSYLNDSEPPSIALAAVKDMRPEIALDYAYRMQQALFLHGQDLNRLETHLGLVAEFQLDKDEFTEKFISPVYRAKARQEFRDVAGLGVSGFPSLVVKQGEQAEVISAGYRSYQSVKAALDQRLQNR